ncbi:MAG TPA: hypothetical protein VJB99_03340, partial [Patescibacteria group bacterium]|nr:hypothetical protein [Patescibacteria group bacterium]
MAQPVETERQAGDREETSSYPKNQNTVRSVPPKGEETHGEAASRKDKGERSRERSRVPRDQGVTPGGRKADAEPQLGSARPTLHESNL